MVTPNPRPLTLANVLFWDLMNWKEKDYSLAIPADHIGFEPKADMEKHTITGWGIYSREKEVLYKAPVTFCLQYFV